MYPIVMLCSFSGNIGKSTLTKNLLSPYIPGAKIFAVEDVNAGYNQGEAVQLSAERTQAILELVIEASLSSPVLVDVGASNVSNFFAALAEYDGVNEFIAKVIVPTEPSEKVQTDTLSTLHYLIEKLGFDSGKIVLVLNKIPAKLPVDTVFGNLLSSAAELGVFAVGQLPLSETFQIAASMQKTIQELALLSPQTLLLESAALAQSGEDPKAKVRLLLAVASAKKLKVRLDDLFVKLGISIDF
ncbi:MAG: hypothetical protein Q7S87_09855 [Agitococcus sp.]|nr:hypothetical protein [Agitococcus sp.]MDO9177082.1 hypothetical protein [Agitococcus sp.]